MRWVLLVCLCVAAAGMVGAVSVAFIVPCHKSDSSCLKSSSQKAIPVLAAGIPELGIKPLDPMMLDHVSASQAGLNMDFRNTEVRGLKNCVVLNVKRTGQRMNFDVKCSVTLTGDYQLGGKLLVLDIEGKGKYKIKIRDIEVKLVYDLVEVTTGGEARWSTAGWRHSYVVHSGAHFHFQNLFNGNKQLAEPIHKFANDNWKDIFQEVAPPIVKAVVAGIVAETDKFFSKVPKKQLSLD